MSDFVIVERTTATRNGARFQGKIELDVDVPTGYVPVRFGVPQPGEPYLYSDNWVVTCVGKMRRSFIVLRKCVPVHLRPVVHMVQTSTGVTGIGGIIVHDDGRFIGRHFSSDDGWLRNDLLWYLKKLGHPDDFIVKEWFGKTAPADLLERIKNMENVKDEKSDG